MYVRQMKIAVPMLCFLISSTLQTIRNGKSRSDRDVTLQCKRNEYLDAVGRNASGRLQIGCRPLKDNLKAENCMTAKPLQCGGSLEGCQKGRGWPIRIDRSKCNMRLMLSVNGKAAQVKRWNSKSHRIYQGVSCYLMKTRSGKIQKTILLMEACKYGKK
uniref:Ricin B lectin domain-containing protein n=1 Tax=Trichuris muris TaxID=70415 RepID=A0A5S6Q0M2_TRIMR